MRSEVARGGTGEAGVPSTGCQVRGRAYVRSTSARTRPRPRRVVDRAGSARWFAELLGSDCDIIPFDREAALSCAALEAEARHAHRTIETRDLLLLAIAKSRRLGVATRNVSHFRGLGVPIYDPFKDLRLM
jgi:hypothetical protein